MSGTGETSTPANSPRRDVTNLEIRKELKAAAQRTETVMRSDVVDSATDSLPVDGDRVAHELDVLEKNGFVYIVNGEVRVP